MNTLINHANLSSKLLVFTTNLKYVEDKKYDQQRDQKNMDPGKIKILVVEDDLLIQKVVSLFLKDLGYQFDIAGDGKKALELYYHNQYDLILMDVELPDTNGIAITETIRANETSKKNLPIVAMTSRTDQACKDKCLLAGMNAFHNKPTSIDEIKAIVKQWVAK